MNLRDIGQRIAHGFAHPDEELTHLQKFLRAGWFVGGESWRILARARGPQLSAALAYRTIFSLVPVLVLTLVAMRAVFGEEGITKGLHQFMSFIGISQIRLNADAIPAEMMGPYLPGDPQVEAQLAVESLLDSFIENAVSRVTNINVGIVAVVSLLVFIYAAISLMVQVEQSFNAICEAKRGRRLMVRVTTYWTLLTLGAPIVFASFVAGTSYLAALANVPDWLWWAKGPLWFLINVGSVWLVLVFAYTQMPTTRLGVRASAVGALLAAVSWTACRDALTFFIRDMSSSHVAIYGAIALLPIFLMWVYITWVLILLGLAVARAIHTAPAVRAAAAMPEETTAKLVDPLAAVGLLRMVARGFERGRQVSAPELVERLGISAGAVETIAESLVGAGFLVQVDDDVRVIYALARPADRIMLDDAVRAVQGATTLGERRDDREEEVQALRALREMQLKPLHGVSLAGVGEATAHAG